MVPRKFHEFLQSGCNKTRLIELLFEYLQLNKDEVLRTLRSDNLVLSSDNSCVVVSRVAVMEDLSLSSDQEEGDTKIILHCANVLHGNHGENVCLWSPSGDTVVVLAVGLLQEFNDRVFIVNGYGSNTNITSSVILKLTLKVQLLIWVSMLSQAMTMSRRFSGKEKKNVGK